MDKAYALLSDLIAPLLPLWLFWRRLSGKEDKARIKERFGYASRPRPKGALLWLHAASVGEAMSVLPFIAVARDRFPALSILLTTGTKTSAALMAKRLPMGVIHQYVPVDTKEATGRFMRHWRPDVALFVESEFWPNLIRAAADWQCFLGIVNGRMSEKSFRFWNKHPAFAAQVFPHFDVAFAQSEEDRSRLQALGVKRGFCLGNVKYDALPLPCDENQLLALKKTVGARPVWLAASTHPGEEKMVMQAHARLTAKYPDLLTLIVPRHPDRGQEIAGAMPSRVSASRRARGDAVMPQTGVYIGDTLGELGLFYRVSEIAFMGGSLVAHGGQNPIEPARFSCAVLTGPHTHNFAGMYRDMEQAGACLRVKNAEDLALRVDALLMQPDTRQTLQTNARRWLEGKSGATARLIEHLTPVFSV